MAHHKLKDAGYNVTFLCAALDVKKNDELKVTPN